MHAAALVLLMLMIYIVGTRPPPLAGFFSVYRKGFTTALFQHELSRKLKISGCICKRSVSTAFGLEPKS